MQNNNLVQALAEAIKADLTKWYIDIKHEVVAMKYYNPDSTSGGSIVNNEVDFDTLVKIFEKNSSSEDIYWAFIDSSREFWCDKGSDDYEYELEDFLLKRNEHFKTCGIELPNELGGVALIYKNRNKSLSSTDILKIYELADNSDRDIEIDFEEILTGKTGIAVWNNTQKVGLFWGNPNGSDDCEISEDEFNERFRITNVYFDV